MNKLLEELRALPAFNTFEKAVNDKLNINNTYVEHFAPEKRGYYDEKDDDGRQVCYPYTLSDEKVEDEAIENLLDDNSGYFEEFVTQELTYDITELARALIKEIRK